MNKTDTICKVKNCTFHHPDDFCGANEIQVDTGSYSAVCETFYPRDESKQIVSGQDVSAGLSDSAYNTRGINTDLFGHSSESFANNDTPLVACNMDDCKFWEDEVCRARTIIIEGPSAAVSDDTRCKTYEPKEDLSD